MEEITVIAPATVSNVVCGFDCLGFALGEPYDELTVRLIDTPIVKISDPGGHNLPADPNKNVAGRALRVMIHKLGGNTGFDISCKKNIKPGSGIGSSGASAGGAVVAANKLLNNRFSNLELVDFALAGEEIASGSRHADNVAPCIYGGFVLVRSLDPLDIVELDYPPLFVTIIHPQIEIKTAEARAMLSSNVPLKDAVLNWSNLGAFVSGLSTGDYDLITRSLEDFIVEPVRKTLIPKFDALKSESLSAGALGGGISGSGPSVFMLSETKETARHVESVMKNVYTPTGIDFNTYVTWINPDGVRIKD